MHESNEPGVCRRGSLAILTSIDGTYVLQDGKRARFARGTRWHTSPLPQRGGGGQEEDLGGGARASRVQSRGAVLSVLQVCIRGSHTVRNVFNVGVML